MTPCNSISIALVAPFLLCVYLSLSLFSCAILLLLLLSYSYSFHVFFFSSSHKKNIFLRWSNNADLTPLKIKITVNPWIANRNENHQQSQSLRCRCRATAARACTLLCFVRRVFAVRCVCVCVYVWCTPLLPSIAFSTLNCFNDRPLWLCFYWAVVSPYMLVRLSSRSNSTTSSQPRTPLVKRAHEVGTGGSPAATNTMQQKKSETIGSVSQDSATIEGIIEQPCEGAEDQADHHGQLISATSAESSELESSPEPPGNVVFPGVITGTAVAVSGGPKQNRPKAKTDHAKYDSSSTCNYLPLYPFTSSYFSSSNANTTTITTNTTTTTISTTCFSCFSATQFLILLIAQACCRHLWPLISMVMVANEFGFLRVSVCMCVCCWLFSKFPGVYAQLLAVRDHWFSLVLRQFDNAVGWRERSPPFRNIPRIYHSRFIFMALILSLVPIRYRELGYRHFLSHKYQLRLIVSCVW